MALHPGGLHPIRPIPYTIHPVWRCFQEDFAFSCGETRRVAGAYMEFAERLVLPQFRHLPVRLSSLSQHVIVFRALGFRIKLQVPLQLSNPVRPGLAIRGTTATAAQLSKRKGAVLGRVG